jgi:hypothetical protein
MHRYTPDELLTKYREIREKIDSQSSSHLLNIKKHKSFGALPTLVVTIQCELAYATS